MLLESIQVCIDSTSSRKAARSAKKIFLDYLREALGAKMRILSHTTSASLPARGPLLNMNRGAKMRVLSHTTSASLPADRPLLNMIEAPPGTRNPPGTGRAAAAPRAGRTLWPGGPYLRGNHRRSHAPTQLRLASPARTHGTHGTHDTNRNRNRFPGWGR